MGNRSGKGGCCGWFLVLVVALVVGLAIYFTIKSKHQNSEADGEPGGVSKKYADALKIALQFFDVQKCNSSVSSFSYAILFHIYISRIKKMKYLMLLLILVRCRISISKSILTILVIARLKS